MGNGFDIEGNLLEGLQTIGLKGVEIGPLSLK